MQPYPKRPDESGQDLIAEAWRDRAGALADWVEMTLVNRQDCHGAYWVDADGVVRQKTEKVGPDYMRLTQHFGAAATEDVIGLHTTAPDETCRWDCVDIDAHPGDGASPDANLRFALHVHDRARAANLGVRLFDSNGNGGYHIWVVFHRPVPAEMAWRFGKWLVDHWADFGLANSPESFPKSPQLRGKRYGNWVRLPGRHAKRSHWTRVWLPERKKWGVGAAAVGSLLKFKATEVDLTDVIPDDFTGMPPRPPRRLVKHVSHPTITLGQSREVVKAREALTFLCEDSYDDYHQWLMVGMALRELDDDGLNLWDEWSQRSDYKYDPAALAEKWNTFLAGDECGGVTLGTLFHVAVEAGWAGPSDVVEERDGRIIRRIDAAHRRGTIHIPVTKIERDNRSM